MPVDEYDPEKDQVYWWVVLSTVLTWILTVVAAAADTWFQRGNFSLGDECYGGGGFCARYATATAFQYIATLACSAAVLLLALSAFAKGYGGESHSPVEGVRDAGQPPPWRSGLISSRELGRAGVWGLLVFTVAEFLVFIVMTDLRNRDLSAISRGDTYNCAITATVFAILQAIALSLLRDHGTFNGGIVHKENTAHDVGRYCTVYNAYHAVIASALLITWPFAVEGAAGNQWVGSPVALALGGTCRVYSSDDFCPGYYIATLIQYLATVVCSCAVVALALATMIERPVGPLVPDVFQRQELVKTGAWGLLCYAATQLLAFAVVAGIKEEYLKDDPYGDTFAVAVTSVFVAAAQAFGIFRWHPKCRIHGPIFARFGPQQNGFQSVHYWTTAASSIITLVFSVIIAADDGWLRDRSKLDSCTNSDEEHCEPYKAAVDFQIFATCCCSIAFAMLVGSAIAPTKSREASSETSTYLGWLGGCSLVLYAFTQLVVLCMMSGIRNRYFHAIRYGPTLGFALFTSLMAAVQGCVVLLSYSTGTRNGGVVGFTVRSSRVHAYTNRAPYWAAIETGQETKTTDGDQDHVTTGFRVWHPKAMTEFTVLRLASDHPHFEVLANQFRECWKKGPAPDVARIYEIQLNGDLARKIEAYHISKGNVCVAYHGTRCHSACDFFVKEQVGPCGRRTCSVCNICMKGFTVEKVGRTARSSSIQLRYGNGHYFSRASGKAHDYSRTKVNLGLQRHHVVLVCEVSLGRAFTAKTHNLHGQSCPRPGYDSTEGLTREQGGSLNFDEVVVYDDAAARPTHLISYSFED
ncbi:unnamed protein product [Ectocarpus sp. 13 AM-2016]